MRHSIILAALLSQICVAGDSLEFEIIELPDSDTQTAATVPEPGLFKSQTLLNLQDDLARARRLNAIGASIYFTGVAASYGSIALTFADFENWDTYFITAWVGYGMQKVGLGLACVGATRAIRAQQESGWGAGSVKVPWAAFACAGLMELGSVGALYGASKSGSSGGVLTIMTVVLWFGKQVPQVIAAVNSLAVAQGANIAKRQSARASRLSIEPTVSATGACGLTLGYRF